MRGRMLEGLQCCVHFSQKPAQIAEQLRRMRTHLRKDCSSQKTQQPNQPLRTIRAGDFRKKLAAAIWQHTRQRELRRAFREMHQRLALHIDERRLARGVHHFEDKRTTVRRG